MEIATQVRGTACPDPSRVDDDHAARLGADGDVPVCKDQQCSDARIQATNDADGGPRAP